MASQTTGTGTSRGSAAVIRRSNAGLIAISVSVAFAVVLGGGILAIWRLSDHKPVPTVTVSVAPTAISVPTPTLTPPATQPPATPAPPKADPPPPPAGNPGVAGAIDVTRFGHSDFASHSGQLWCGLSKEEAGCHFSGLLPEGKLPKWPDVCPKDEGRFRPTGVSVKDKTKYFCSGGVVFFPGGQGDNLAWHRETGFPTVDGKGASTAVLPYGKKLKSGNYVCLLEDTGVTCANVKTGRGFKTSSNGTVIF